MAAHVQEQDDESQFADGRVRTWFLSTGRLPLFIRPNEGAFANKALFLDWVKDQRGKLDQLILGYGAIVLRGFPIATAEDFNDVISLFPHYEAGYIGGGAPRATVVGKVMEATRAAPDTFLCLHQEMAYLPKYPPRLAFFCRKPAETGGETIIGSMKAFTRRLPGHIRERLETQGVRGVRNYIAAGEGRGEVADARDGMAWDEAFNTSDKAEVEAACATRGLEPVWRDDGGLVVLTQLEPFSDHPITGERYYRSIIHTHYMDPPSGTLTHKPEGPLATGYLYGDGAAMSLEDAQGLNDTLNELTVSWKWQAGDLMMLDNLQVAHGRNRYSGQRETLVALLGSPAI